jgi:hypothetical protein
LIGQRDEAVHHNEETAPAVPHPYYTTNVAGVDASFSMERVSDAVDLMLDVLERAIVHPTPALTSWAKGQAHTLDMLKRMRLTGEDF